MDIYANCHEQFLKMSDNSINISEENESISPITTRIRDRVQTEKENDSRASTSSGTGMITFLTGVTIPNSTIRAKLNSKTSNDSMPSISNTNTSKLLTYKSSSKSIVCANTKKKKKVTYSDVSFEKIENPSTTPTPYSSESPAPELPMPSYLKKELLKKMKPDQPFVVNPKMYENNDERLEELKRLYQLLRRTSSVEKVEAPRKSTYDSIVDEIHKSKLYLESLRQQEFDLTEEESYSSITESSEDSESMKQHWEEISKTRKIRLLKKKANNNNNNKNSSKKLTAVKAKNIRPRLGREHEK